MNELKQIFAQIFEKLFWLADVDIAIIPSPKPELGEYCINVFPFMKPLRQSPQALCEAIGKELLTHSDTIKNINIMGGYLNFFLTDKFWKKMFADTLTLPKPETKDETIVVDYIGMNVGKPPHVGHICTPLLGQAIINTLRYKGYRVIGDSHLGDWGSLFGKLIVGYKKYGNPDKLREDAISHLLEVYVALNADIEQNPELEEETRNAFKKLSEWEKEYTNLWQEFVTASISTNKKILEMMHVHQDFDIGESFYEGLDLPKIGTQPSLQYPMNTIVKEMLDKGIATKNDDGSVGVVFPEETKIPSTILQKKDGTNLYLTSDLATIKYRLTNGWNPSKILYFVDARQSLHLKQVFFIAKKAWTNINQNVEFCHVANGAIVLPEGAMSTRKGNIIRLDLLVKNGFDRVKTILEEKGRTGERVLSDKDIQEITVGAIKYMYLAQDRERDVVFTWDKALNFEGNSWPYIQYAYVRAKKIRESAGDISYDANSDFSLSEYDKTLIMKLQDFPKKVEEMLAQYKPHILAHYAYDIATTFNSFYVHTPKILEEPDEKLKNFRLTLVEHTAHILQTVFALLGIEMPSEM